MLKCLTLTLVLLSLLALKTRAQNLRDDSIKKIAVADAGKFKLDKASLKKFRQNRRNLALEYFELGGSDADAPGFKRPGGGFSIYRRNRELESDYFKPIASAVSDTALLKDSVYVAAYREKAWQPTRHRRTVAHYAWMTGTVVAGATVIAAWVYVISISSHVKSIML